MQYYDKGGDFQEVDRLCLGAVDYMLMKRQYLWFAYRRCEVF